MEPKPLVSIAIITYNQVDFLKEAIDSVLSQDYPSIEIVVGDDCSTDGTQEMLRSLDKKYPGKFLLALSDKNKGITQNSNAVHSLCNGKYIAWLGGDDLMLPGKIAKQAEFLEHHPDYNIIYHNLEVFDSETQQKIKLYNTITNAHEGDVSQLIKYGTFNGACSTMVRRSASPSFGFDTRLPVSSDWFYWIGHLSKDGKIGYINEVLGKYRKHNKNVTNSTSPFAMQGFKDVLLTTDLIEQEFPRYKNIINYRRSNIYRDMRRIEYKSNLVKSIRLNPFNIKSWLLLSLHLLSFGKIKLY